MKPLLYIDLDEQYKLEMKFSKAKNVWGYYLENLEQLITMIEKEKNSIDFKNELLAITQLYFDGVVSKEERRDSEGYQRQKEILDKLCLIGKTVTGSFYRGKDVNLDGLREDFLPNASEIISYGSKNRAKKRHLDSLPSHIQAFGVGLSNALPKIQPVDTLLCIASSGFEPSFLAMDILEKDSLTIVRYSRVEKKDSEVMVPRKDEFVSSVKGQNVLVVEDIISTGKTLAKVIDFTANMKPKKLYGTVVLGHSSTNLWGIRIKVLEEKGCFVFKYEGRINQKS